MAFVVSRGSPEGGLEVTSRRIRCGRASARPRIALTGATMTTRQADGSKLEQGVARPAEVDLASRQLVGANDAQPDAGWPDQPHVEKCRQEVVTQRPPCRRVVQGGVGS